MAKFTRLVSLGALLALLLTGVDPAVINAAPERPGAPAKDMAPAAVNCLPTVLPLSPLSTRQAPQDRPLAKIAETPNATYSAPDTPLRMIPGDEYRVNLTLRNTTATAWPKATHVLS